jgi:predicted transcriptional regulator of viral defense system
MSSKLNKAQVYLKKHPILTVSEAQRLGISRTELKRWVDAGAVHRIGRGVYSLIEPMKTPDELIVTLRPPCAIGGITALIHYGYTNVIGHKTWILVPKNHAVISRPDVETMRQNLNIYKLGLVTMKTDWGPVQIVDREKAVLDAYRGRYLDLEEKYRVLKRYIKDPEHNYNNLLKYVDKMRVNKNIHNLFMFLDAEQ